jgi:hypothetical protein
MKRVKKYKLIGSAPSLEMLKTLIGKYLYSDKIELIQELDNIWKVTNSGKELDYIVIYKSKRYRFEMPLNNNSGEN